jgi:hypothetical protein
MYVHCICMYILCIYMYIHVTWVPHIVCITCTAVCIMIGMYYAPYRNQPLCTNRDIPPIYPLRMAVETTGSNLYVHCIYMYIWCIYMYIHCTWVPHFVCIYHSCTCHCILACTLMNLAVPALKNATGICCLVKAGYSGFIHSTP